MRAAAENSMARREGVSAICTGKTYADARITGWATCAVGALKDWVARQTASIMYATGATRKGVLRMW